MTEPNTETLERNREESSTAVLAPKDQPQWAAMTDLYETHEAMVLFLDVPGVSEDSLDVTLEKDHLTLAARSQHDVPKEGMVQAWAEYVPVTYYRRFRLTHQIDQSGIEAQLKDGVLRITLPKIKQAAARKVPIRIET